MTLTVNVHVLILLAWSVAEHVMVRVPKPDIKLGLERSHEGPDLRPEKSNAVGLAHDAVTLGAPMVGVKL